MKTSHEGQDCEQQVSTGYATTHVVNACAVTRAADIFRFSRPHSCRANDTPLRHRYILLNQAATFSVLYVEAAHPAFGTCLVLDLVLLLVYV